MPPRVVIVHYCWKNTYWQDNNDINHWNIFSDQCDGVSCGFYATCKYGKCVCPSCKDNQIYDPICDITGLSHANECFLKSASCKQKEIISISKRRSCGMNNISHYFMYRYIFLFTNLCFFKSAQYIYWDLDFFWWMGYPIVICLKTVTIKGKP